MRAWGVCAVALACGASTVYLSPALAARADDYHIDTTLYVGDAKQPSSENVTLFHSGQVYDFPAGEGEITVFDPPRARFILLDPARKVQVEMPTAEIERFARGLQNAAAERSPAQLKFLANPKFEEAIDPSTGETTYSSPWLTYILRTESARTEEAARQYSEFSDWYARLNTMTGGTPLPLARLEINARLRERRLIPTQVTRTLIQPRGLLKQEVVVRTEHHVTWGLSATDLDRINRVGDDLARFEKVSYRRFRDGQGGTDAEE